MEAKQERIASVGLEFDSVAGVDVSSEKLLGPAAAQILRHVQRLPAGIGAMVEDEIPLPPHIRARLGNRLDAQAVEIRPPLRNRIRHLVHQITQMHDLRVTVFPDGKIRLRE